MSDPHCPDCRGSGLYVGFTHTGPCLTCSAPAPQAEHPEVFQDLLQAYRQHRPRGRWTHPASSLYVALALEWEFLGGLASAKCRSSHNPLAGGRAHGFVRCDATRGGRTTSVPIAWGAKTGWSAHDALALACRNGAAVVLPGLSKEFGWVGAFLHQATLYWDQHCLP